MRQEQPSVLRDLLTVAKHAGYLLLFCASIVLVMKTAVSLGEWVFGDIGAAIASLIATVLLIILLGFMNLREHRR